MSFFRHSAFAAACLTTALLLITGCAATQFGTAPDGGSAHFSLKGNLHGGQQPVSGSTIQLYAASSTANAGASTPLLTAPVSTASDGSFSITGDYVCPASNPLVYLVATGGNPGLPGSVNNQQLAMMALYGTCNDLLANAATTYIYIDELTTVASVQAIASFMTDYAHVGAAPSNPTALAGAFENATGEINFQTGQFSFSPGVDLPYVTINTLSNIIAACVNSAGGSAGDGSACGSLLSYSGTTTDTITATLHMIQSPAQNTQNLYNLISANPPFQPYFTSAPSDFTTTVGYTLPSAIQAAAVDSNGRLWIYTGGYSYNTVTDTSTDVNGYITVYDNNLNPTFTIPAGTGGMYYVDSMSADANGHVFTVNANNTISEFASSGSAISPPSGYSTGVTTTFSPSGPGNGYIDGTNQIDSITVDALGNIFGVPPYGYTSSSTNSCYFELNSSGAVSTPSGTFCSSSGISSIEDAVTDGSGNFWALAASTVAKGDTAGNLAATAPSSQGCFYTSGSSPSRTSGLVYDHVNNQLWGHSELGAGAISDAGAALFCDYGSSALPVTPLTAISSSAAAGSPYTGSNRAITNGVLDGAGNFWFVTGGLSATGAVGTTAGTFTGTVTYSTFLGEINSSGTLVTGNNASTNNYGYQPAGLGTNGTASATNTRLSAAESAELIGVDKYGNIWGYDLQTNKVLKITGLATANTVNY